MHAVKPELPIEAQPYVDMATHSVMMTETAKGGLHSETAPKTDASELSQATERLQHPDIVAHARKSFADLPKEEQEGIQRDFETLYGVDYKTRNRDQWKRLVDKYGIPFIMQQEKLTKAYIKAKLKPGKL